MTIKSTNEVLHRRLEELRAELKAAMAVSDWKQTMPARVYRLQGNIGTLEWVLRLWEGRG